MANDVRNPADVLSENIAKDIQVTRPVSPVSSGSNAGSGAAGSAPLTFRDEGGNAKKWFKWSRHHFDDPDAMFY